MFGAFIVAGSLYCYAVKLSLRLLFEIRGFSCIRPAAQILSNAIRKRISCLQICLCVSQCCLFWFVQLLVHLKADGWSHTAKPIRSNAGAVLIRPLQISVGPAACLPNQCVAVS